MRATIPLQLMAIILTKAHCSMVSRVLYCSLSTASEVFLMFSTQLYSCLYIHNAIVFIYWRD